MQNKEPLRFIASRFATKPTSTSKPAIETVFLMKVIGKMQWNGRILDGNKFLSINPEMCKVFDKQAIADKQAKEASWIVLQTLCDTLSMQRK